MYAAGAQQAGGMGGVPSAVPVGGQSVYPPQFQYGGFSNIAPRTGFGAVQPGMMSSMATGSVGALGMLPGTLGGIAGAASMFSPSTTLAGLGLLDASGIGAAMHIGGAGLSGGGLAAAGAALPAAAGLAVAGGAAYGGYQFARGGAEYNQTGAALAGYNFANPMAPSGRGFGYGQTAQITNMMRQFEDADPFTTMRDLNELMGSFNEMEIAQGVRNAREFSEKFKKFADSVRDIATELGTSLGEAAQMFGEMRRTGFYDSADVMGNTRQMQVASGLGMSNQDFLGMQRQAAGMTRQAQMSGLAGARTSARFSQDLLMGATSRASGGMGLFSPEELMDITGAGTQGEAAAQMGAQFTGLLTGYLRRSAAGKALLAGVGGQEDGRFTGEADAGLLGEFASGNVSLQDLSRRASGRTRTSRQQGSFVTHESEIASAILESESGVEAALSSLESSAREWGGSRGIKEDDAVRLFLQEVVHADELMAEKVAEFMKHRQELRARGMQRMRQEQAASAMQLDMARNRTFAGLYQRAAGTFEDFGSGVAAAGTDLGAYVDSSFMRLQDSVFGVSRGQVTNRQMLNMGMRVGSGQSLAAGTAAGPALGDFEFGTAGWNAARSAGAASTLSSRRRLLAGGGVRDEDFGFSNDQLSAYRQRISGGMDELSGKFTPGMRDQIQQITSRYSAALARGDEGAQAAALEELREKAREVSPGLQWEGNSDRVAAFLAKEAGAEGMATRLLLKGATSTSAAGDVASAAESTYRTARNAGLDEATARALSEGGAGSSIIALAGQGDEQRAYVENFLTRRLGEFGGDMDAAAEAFGHGATAEDILAAQKVFSVGGESTLGRLGSLGSAGLMAASGSYLGRARVGALMNSPLESRRDRIDQIIRSTSRSQDMRASRAGQAAIAGNLAQFSDELRSVLGRDTIRALEDGGDLAGPLGTIVDKIEAGRFDGILGGQEFAAIGARMSKARKSNKALKDVYGMSEEEALRQARALGINLNDNDRLDAEERAALVERMGRGEVFASLTSGSGGGTVMRGASAEQQMLYQMGFTADKVRRMGEVVESLVNSAEKKNLVEPASKTAEGE